MYDVFIHPNRVIVTTGSSAAFLLAFLGCFTPGDAVGLCSSGYPCYRNIMKATELEYVSIPINSQFKITADEIAQEIQRRRELNLKPLRGLILSSPSNPTDVMLSENELKTLCEICESNQILFLSDEIYHGISYGNQKEQTAVKFSNSAIVITSFSKYFSMTGWRLGWMIVPESLVDVMNRLTQNMYINPPTLSQHAACSAFDCADELNNHVVKYSTNRKIVLDTLESLDLLDGSAPSDGAFYIYVDLSKQGVHNSTQLCYRLLDEAGVAITPGTDFEDPMSGLANQRILFSYSRSTDEVQEGMNRFKK